MNTLVTGGCGFVGSNLVDILVNSGDKVFVVDNLSSESSSLNYKNKNAEYFFINAIDLLSNNYLIDTRFDRIFHLAAEARIQPSFERPLDYFNNNTMVTATVCEFARIRKVGSLVYAATSSKNHGTPYLTPYTYSKVAGEGIVRTYSNCFGMNTSICTFYNVYGPREPYIGDYATVVAKFLRQHKSGEFLTVVGDGSQTRDFTHVEDICNGMIKASLGNYKGENFDLGRGDPIRIIDLAKMISNKIKFVPLRKNEGLHTLSNYEETFKKLGWRASHSLKDYLKSTL